MPWRETESTARAGSASDCRTPRCNCLMTAKVALAKPLADWAAPPIPDTPLPGHKPSGITCPNPAIAPQWRGFPFGRIPLHSRQGFYVWCSRCLHGREPKKRVSLKGSCGIKEGATDLRTALGLGRNRSPSATLHQATDLKEHDEDTDPDNQISCRERIASAGYMVGM